MDARIKHILGIVGIIAATPVVVMAIRGASTLGG